MDLIIFDAKEGSETLLDSDCHYVPLLIDLDILAKIDKEDEWSNACLMVGKSVLNQVREIMNE